MITEDELFENYYLDEEEIITYENTNNNLINVARNSNNKEKYLKFLEESLKK